MLICFKLEACVVMCWSAQNSDKLLSNKDDGSLHLLLCLVVNSSGCELRTTQQEVDREAIHVWISHLAGVNNLQCDFANLFHCISIDIAV